MLVLPLANQACFHRRFFQAFRYDEVLSLRGFLVEDLFLNFGRPFNDLFLNFGILLMDIFLGSGILFKNFFLYYGVVLDDLFLNWGDIFFNYGFLLFNGDIFSSLSMGLVGCAKCVQVQAQQTNGFRK